MKILIKDIGKKLQGNKDNKNLQSELFEKKKILKKMVRNKKRLHRKYTIKEMEVYTNMSQKSICNYFIGRNFRG